MINTVENLNRPITEEEPNEDIEISSLPVECKEEEMDYCNTYVTLESIIASINQCDLDKELLAVETEVLTQVPIEKKETTVVKPPTPVGFEFKAGMKALLAQIGHGTRLVSKEINDGAKRSYGIVWLPHFVKDTFYNYSAYKRNFHECVPAEEPCRIHLDVDLKLTTPISQKLKMNSAEAGKRLQVFKTNMLQHAVTFIRALLNALDTTFDLQKTSNFTNGETYEGSCLILESTNESKFSLHLIFKLNEDKILFKNKRSLGNFIRTVLETELNNNKFFDPSESFAMKNAGLKRHPFSVYSEAKINGKPAWEYLSYHSNSETNEWNVPVVPYQLFLTSLDLGIYDESDREFRMFSSTKFNQMRPLKYVRRLRFTLAPTGRQYKLASLNIEKKDPSAVVYSLNPPKGLFEPSIPSSEAISKMSEAQRAEKEAKEDKEYDSFLFGGREDEGGEDPFKDDKECLKINSGDQNLEDLKRFLFEDEREEEKVIATKDDARFTEFAKLFYDSLVIPFWHPRATDVLYEPEANKRFPRCLLYCLNPAFENKMKLENSLYMRKMALMKAVEARKKLLGESTTTALIPTNPVKREEETKRTNEDVENNIWSFFSNHSRNPYSCLRSNYASSDEIREHLPYILEEIFGPDGDAKDDDRNDDEEEDDVLGISLISAIAANVELKMRILDRPKARLVYVKELRNEEEGYHCLYYLAKDWGMCQIKALMTQDPEACHASNNTYFVVRLNDYQFYQKCYAPDCKKFYAKNVAKVDPSDIVKFESAGKNARGDYFTLDPSLQSRIEKHKRKNKGFKTLYDKHFQDKPQ